MRKTFATCLGLSMLLASSTGWAQNYDVNVTRKGSNVYKVMGKDIIIQTRYCYAYAYSEDAILKSGGAGGELIFLSSKDRCDVKAVYGSSPPKPGRYSVTVSRAEDEWFEVFGTDTYIKTSMCLSLALGEQATLTINAGGVGRLQFQNGTDCMVEGIYARMRL